MKLSLTMFVVLLLTLTTLSACGNKYQSVVLPADSDEEIDYSATRDAIAEEPVDPSTMPPPFIEQTVDSSKAIETDSALVPAPATLDTTVVLDQMPTTL